MDGRTGSLRFAAATIMLIFVAAFFCVGTVMSRTDFDARELESYYREKEEEMIKEIRAYLDSRGFAYSGVMLGRVTDSDGSRAYTITVHHGAIGLLADDEREKLNAGLEDLVFQDEKCSFQISLD